jgi:hypothetical protein
MNEQQMRALEITESSVRKTGAILKTSPSRIWLWRRGVCRLTDAEERKLEQFLAGRLSERLKKLESLTTI